VGLYIVSFSFVGVSDATSAQFSATAVCSQKGFKFLSGKCSSFRLHLWEGTQLLYCISHDELTSPTLHILSDFVPQRVTAEDALKVTGLQQIVV
jgi:hypothetical protein